MLTFDDVKPYLIAAFHSDAKQYNYYIISYKEALYEPQDEFFKKYNMEFDKDYAYYDVWDNGMEWIYAFNDLTQAIAFKLEFE